ncbi:hypothetical protein EV1_039199 [Malus domestica]
MVMVKHFNHCHELCPFQVQEEDDEIIICSGCDLELMMNSGASAYKCSKSKCEFYLHDLCFELPRQIKHKSHPQHPLIPHLHPSLRIWRVQMRCLRWIRL